MSDEHVALAVPKGREMVEVVLAEFDKWAEHAPSQAAGVIPSDPEEAARFALNDVREELADHLVIPVGITIASWGGTDE